MNKVEKINAMVVLGIFISMVLSGSTIAQGTPIEITDCNELQNMNADLTADYILMNDIDCTDTVNWNSGAGFVPIGDADNPFTGTFDGNGFTIKYLYTNRPVNNVGLFGYVGSTDGSSSPTIENVNLDNFDITGNGNVGGLFGWCGHGTINNVHADGSINGLEHLGVLGGTSYHSDISYSSSSGSVNGAQSGNTVDIWYGGLVSSINHGQIYRSYSSADVIGNYKIGGLVGENSFGSISESFATGNVDGFYRVGGFIGNNIGGSISDSYATGDVSGSHEVAGFAGLQLGGGITNSYSTGKPTGSSNVYGFLAYYMSGSCTANFWDTETSGKDTDDCPTGSTGLPTADMQTESTFIDALWDFDNTWKMVGYPHLQWATVEALGDLIGNIQDLVDDETLNNGQGNSLISKLQNIIAKINDGKLNAACGQLNAFIEQVNDYVWEDCILTESQGQYLIDAAMNIKNAIGC